MDSGSRPTQAKGGDSLPVTSLGAPVAYTPFVPAHAASANCRRHMAVRWHHAFIGAGDAEGGHIAAVNGHPSSSSHGRRQHREVEVDAELGGSQYTPCPFTTRNNRTAIACFTFHRHFLRQNRTRMHTVPNPHSLHPLMTSCIFPSLILSIQYPLLSCHPSSTPEVAHPRLLPAVNANSCLFSMR